MCLMRFRCIVATFGVWQAPSGRRCVSPLRWDLMKINDLRNMTGWISKKDLSSLVMKCYFGGHCQKRFLVYYSIIPSLWSCKFYFWNKLLVAPSVNTKCTFHHKVDAFTVTKLMSKLRSFGCFWFSYSAVHELLCIGVVYVPVRNAGST